MTADQFAKVLEKAYRDYAFHELQFPSERDARRFLTGLSFLSSRRGRMEYPDELKCVIVPQPDGSCVLLFGGRPTLEQHIEIIRKGRRKALKLASRAAGAAEHTLRAAEKRASLRGPRRKWPWVVAAIIVLAALAAAAVAWWR